MRLHAALFIWLVLPVVVVDAQFAEPVEEDAGLIGFPELLESVDQGFHVPATLDHASGLSNEWSKPPLREFENSLRISAHAMLGRRVFDPAHMDEYESNAGLLLSTEYDFRSRFLGFDGWDSNVRWLQSDSHGLVESEERITIYAGASIGSEVSNTLIRYTGYESFGDQNFVSTDLNLYRELWLGKEDRANVSFLSGLRYLYSGEKYDNFVRTRSNGAPFWDGSYELTNHMLGGQIGLRGNWSTNRVRIVNRLVGGLMYNRLQSEDRAEETSATSLEPTYIVRSHDEERLSTLIEAETMMTYRLRQSVDLGLGCYAIHITNQAPEANAGSHDLTLLGLKCGVGYSW